MAVNKTLSAILGVFLAVGLAACDREGPAEQAGENVDEAAENAGEQMEEAAEDAGDAMENAGDRVEQETQQP